MMLRIVAVALACCSLPLVVAAQDKPAPALEVSAGWVGFPDDSVVSEAIVGGAARFYVFPRVSVGPEVTYIAGDNHSHLMITGNVTWDVLPPVNGRARAVSPFFVIGAGLFQTRESLAGRGTFTSREGAFTAGGGVRAAIGDRAAAGVEARVGWELHLRITGLIGFSLGR